MLETLPGYVNKDRLCITYTLPHLRIVVILESVLRGDHYKESKGC